MLQGYDPSGQGEKLQYWFLESVSGSRQGNCISKGRSLGCKVKKKGKENGAGKDEGGVRDFRLQPPSDVFFFFFFFFLLLFSVNLSTVQIIHARRTQVLFELSRILYSANMSEIDGNNAFQTKGK
jgi:hypothetical protein